MKHLLLSAVMLVTILSGGKITGQTTGYLSFPEPNNNNRFSRMIHTSDGGFISLGQGGLAGVNHDITKFDANFQVQWYKNFDGTAVTNWNDVIETNDGKFIVMGANANHQGCNIVFKLNTTGTLLWQKEYYIAGNFLTSFALSKTAGTDPGFIFGGGACAGSNFLVRCDANGTIVWQQEYYIMGGSGVETILNIKAESDHYILSGYAGFGTDIDAYIMRVDSSNVCAWCNLVTEPVRPQVPYRVLKLASGNYVMLCGYNSNPNYSQLLYYFNANGTVTNAIKLTSPTQEEINFGDLVEVGNGRIILNGSINANPMSYLYLELDANGAIVWQKKGVGVLTGFHNGTGVTLAKTNTNLYALGGDSYEDGRTITVIDSTGTGACSSVAASITSIPAESFTMTPTTPLILSVTILSASVTNVSNPLTITQSTLCGTLGENEITKAANDISIYPNPSDDFITIIFGEKSSGNSTVTFYNVMGEMVKAESFSNTNEPKMDISNLTSGIYLMEVIIDGEKSIKRVVKN